MINILTYQRIFKNLNLKLSTLLQILKLPQPFSMIKLLYISKMKTEYITN